MGCHVVSLAHSLDRKRFGDKSKHTFGPKGDGGYFVGPLDPTKPLIIAEGVETLLSAVQLAGELEQVSGVATFGKVNQFGQLPVCSEVIIAQDLDKPDKHGEMRACPIYDAAMELAERIASYDRVRVRIVASPTKTGTISTTFSCRRPTRTRVWDRALGEAEEVKAATLEDAPAMGRFLEEGYPTLEFLMPPLFLRQSTSPAIGTRRARQDSGGAVDVVCHGDRHATARVGSAASGAGGVRGRRTGARPSPTMGGTLGEIATITCAS